MRQMLQEYLDGITDLSSIEVDAPKNILIKSDKGDRVWPALRHLALILNKHLEVASPSEKVTLIALGQVVNNFLERPLQSAGEIKGLFELIDSWLDEKNFSAEELQSKKNLVKALAFIAKALPISLEQLSFAAKLFLPKDWRDQISQLSSKVDATYKLILFYEGNEDSTHHLIGKINKERLEIAQELKAVRKSIQTVKLRVKAFRRTNASLISSWVKLHQILESDEQPLDLFWQEYQEEGDFGALLRSLNLTTSEIERWDKARSKILKHSKNTSSKSNALSLEEIKTALSNAVNEVNKTFLQGIDHRFGASPEYLFDCLMQKRVLSEHETALRQLESFFINEVEIMPRENYSIHSKRCEINKKLLFGIENNLYELGLLRQNINTMKDVLEEQLELINQQKKFVETNINQLNKLKGLSEDILLEGERLVSINKRAKGSYLSLIKEQFILSQPDETNLIIKDDSELMKYYFARLVEMYLTEIEHLTDFISIIDQTGRENFSDVVEKIDGFLKQRKGFVEWLYKLLCPVYRECCEEIECVLHSSIGSIEKLVMINHVIKEGLEKMSWSCFFVRPRLKSIFENTGMHIFSLRNENKQEIKQQYLDMKGEQYVC